MISKLRRTAIAVLIVRRAGWLKSIAVAAVLTTVGIGVSAGPALADTTDGHRWHHHPVPVGSVAGALGVAAIAGISLWVAQRRRRHSGSTQA